MTWRTGNHYGIHVYDGERPVATFHYPEEAAAAVDAVNRYSSGITDDAADALLSALVAKGFGVPYTAHADDHLYVDRLRVPDAERNAGCRNRSALRYVLGSLASQPGKEKRTGDEPDGKAFTVTLHLRSDSSCRTCGTAAIAAWVEMVVREGLDDDTRLERVSLGAAPGEE